MKKVIYSAIIALAFVNVSMANTKEIKLKKVEAVSTLKEIKIADVITKNDKAVKPETDFAGFVCWVFNMHCA
jgi:hypothetical protein